MNTRLIKRSIRHGRLVLAARFNLVVLLLATTAPAQIALQDGSPLTIIHTTGNAINQPFAVTTGANVLVVLVEDKSDDLTEPASLVWNGQTLTRDVQTAYTTGVQRSLAIYHLFNPIAGTTNITGTLGSGVSDLWVTAYTLNGVDSAIGPVTASVNTGGNTAGVTTLSVGLNGLAAGSWAAMNSEYANLGAVTFAGTGGTEAAANDGNDATTTATAGYVAGLSGGAVTLSDAFNPNSGRRSAKVQFGRGGFHPAGRSGSVQHAPGVWD